MKAQHKRTILPEVTKYEPELVDFVISANDISTWAAWQVALRFLVFNQGRSPYGAPFQFNQMNVTDSKNMTRTYIGAQIFLLVEGGNTYPGAIAKKLKMSVSNAIYCIKYFASGMVKEENGKLVTKKDVMSYSVDSLIDPRVGVKCVEERRQSTMFAVVKDITRYGGDEAARKWRTWDKPALSFWYREHLHLRIGESCKGDVQKLDAYNLLCYSLVKYTNFGRYGTLSYDDEKNVFNLYRCRERYWSNEKQDHVPRRIESDVYLKMTKDKKTKQISLTLMRGKNKIGEYSWFSDNTTLINVLSEEYARLDNVINKKKNEPIEFKNDEIACAT